MHIPVQVGHGVILMKNANWSCQVSNMQTCANYCMALPQKAPLISVGKMLWLEILEVLLTPELHFQAHSTHWRCGVKWPWLERWWGGCDGCTACCLHCSISQSVWAANDLKIEGTLRKAEKLAWLSHASSEMSRTWGPIRLRHQQEYVRKPSTELHDGAVPVHQTPAKNSSHIITLLGRVSGLAGSLGEYPLQLASIGK